jgi:hypothetical protein
MRTLCVCLALALPTLSAAAAASHTANHTPKPSPAAPEKRAQPKPAKRRAHAAPDCAVGCHVHHQRQAVRWLRKQVVRRSQQAWLPRPRRPRLSWHPAQVRRELAFWRRKNAKTKRLARVPLARRIPRWSAWQCIAEYESGHDWHVSGGTYWGGLQMDVEFQRTYGEDMIERHHGGLANTWTPVEQIVVANRAWKTRGFQPWPVTSRICGLR